MESQKRKGFTLIELLVVIAIIAILAAILFPVFMQAKERGRQSLCQSHMKQMAMAITQYAQDWNQTFPPNHPNPDLYYAMNDYKWNLFDQYIKNKGIYLCPSALGKRYDPGREDDPSISYYFNVYLADIFITVGPPAKMSQVTCPTRVIMMFETWISQEWYAHHTFMMVLDRHNGGSNYSFVDGHVRWYKGLSALGYASTSRKNKISFAYYYDGS